jgi:hypothetical protein
MFDTVGRYIAAKLAEDNPLSPRSIKVMLTLLPSAPSRVM